MFILGSRSFCKTLNFVSFGNLEPVLPKPWKTLQGLGGILKPGFKVQASGVNGFVQGGPEP